MTRRSLVLGLRGVNAPLGVGSLDTYLRPATPAHSLVLPTDLSVPCHLNRPEKNPICGGRVVAARQSLMLVGKIQSCFEPCKRSWPSLRRRGGCNTHCYLLTSAVGARLEVLCCRRAAAPPFTAHHISLRLGFGVFTISG